LALAAVALAAAEPAATTTSLVLAPNSRLWLAGDSTLHPFTSNATKVEATGRLDLSPAGSPADPRAAIAGGGLKNLSVAVPIDGLKSGESGLDKNLRKALKQESAPVIRFMLVDYKTEAAKDGGLVVKARGRLAIAGVEKETVVDGACRFGPEGVEVTGAKDLLMSEFGIKPPTLMFGAVKTADKVVVHFDLKLKASAAAPEQ
jgi:polyisoprenoid-binding protein YceI